jgi:hypothetical protein
MQGGSFKGQEIRQMGSYYITTCSLLIIAYLWGMILFALFAPHWDEPLENDITRGDTIWKKLAKKTLEVPQGLGMYEFIAFELI